MLIYSITYLQKDFSAFSAKDFASSSVKKNCANLFNLCALKLGVSRLRYHFARHDGTPKECVKQTKYHNQISK